MRKLALALAVCIFSVPVLQAQDKPAKRGVVKLTEEALAIHRDALLIDGHNDLPWQYRKLDNFSFTRFDLAKPQPLLHTDIAGIDHVGLGSDFDGITTCPRQLEDVSTYPYITQELLNRGHSREAIHKILGGNALRALRGAEAAAKNWK